MSLMPLVLALLTAQVEQPPAPPAEVPVAAPASPEAQVIGATQVAPPALPLRDGVLVLPVVGLDCVVVMSSGRRWAGRVTSVSEEMIVVRLARDEEVRLRRQAVRAVIPRAWLDDDMVPFGSLLRGQGRDERLLLDDGEVVRGLVVERSPAALIVVEAGGARREVPAGRVLVEVPLKEERLLPTGRTRYLEVPAAVLPVAGLVEVRSTELVHLSVEAGITDHLSISAGTVVPALHARPYSANVQAAVRSGLSLGERWRVAGGFHLSTSGTGRSTGFLSATATWSSPRASVTIHAGPAFAGLSRLSALGDTAVAVGLGYRLSSACSINSEAWMDLHGGGLFSALAARWMVRRFTIDAGLAAATGRSAPIPWLGVGMEVSP